MSDNGKATKRLLRGCIRPHKALAWVPDRYQVCEEESNGFEAATFGL